jgi:hypothetical protein
VKDERQKDEREREKNDLKKCARMITSGDIVVQHGVSLGQLMLLQRFLSG